MSVMEFSRPGWRRTKVEPDTWETGDGLRGATAWMWLGYEWYRVQVWDRPATRLITYRSRRSLQQAMVKAEAWLSSRPAILPKTCRRCSECRGAEHHWIESVYGLDVIDEFSPSHVCKHCDAEGDECDACDGEGGEVVDIGERDNGGVALCPPCKGHGVIARSALREGQEGKVPESESPSRNGTP